MKRPPRSSRGLASRGLSGHGRTGSAAALIGAVPKTSK